MQRGILVSALALTSLLMGGCGEASRVPPKPPGQLNGRPGPVLMASSQAQAALEERNTEDGPSTSFEGARLATATPNAATGWIEIVITDPPAPCGPYQPFPSTCEPAWRVRISLMPEHQRPGQYTLGPSLNPFAYRDAQGKAGGVWEAGEACTNLGSDIVGTLKLVAIDPDGISGILSGAGEADGPFRAQRCPSCKGTGQACTSNDECCMNDCHAGRCQP